MRMYVIGISAVVGILVLVAAVVWFVRARRI
jgi:hypothetical protein